MTTSSTIEITDQEYLIKLRKTDFDLNFIVRLLKNMQAEQTSFDQYDNEDIISKRAAFSTYHTRFDDLNDK